MTLVRQFSDWMDQLVCYLIGHNEKKMTLKPKTRGAPPERFWFCVRCCRKRNTTA